MVCSSVRAAGGGKLLSPREFLSRVLRCEFAQLGHEGEGRAVFHAVFQIQRPLKLYPGLQRGLVVLDDRLDAFAVIIGEDEAASGLVALKDMRRGEQVSCTPDEAAEKIKTALAESAGTPLIKEK